MPDNKKPGKLEDFIKLLIPSDDALYPKAVECVNQIDSSEKRFSDSDTIKAHIHTWLAWQKEPGVSLSVAIKEKYLNTSAPRAKAFMTWLKDLFEF